MLDRIIFGDNQFFGINHMSEEKAQALSEKFAHIDDIMKVIDSAYECGIRAFMLNSHDKTFDICERLRKNRSRYKELCLYPSIPYPHKYANAVAEKGIFGTLKDTIISNNKLTDIAGLITKGGSLVFDRDMINVMKLLVDIEMKMFRGLNVKVLFLQNIITDLMLGFNVKEIFVAFHEYIEEKYGVKAGFITLNMPHLVEFLISCGIKNPVVCSAINKAGYFMNPNKESYEKTLKQNNFRPIAMSILASGAINAEEAVKYVCSMPAIRSIVYGASSLHHIEQTKNLIDNYITQ
jgi:hypothetical protein